MTVINQSKIKEKKVEMPGCKNTYMKILVDGPSFVMRKFRMRKNSNTPLHKHPWEHEIYVLSGKGKVSINGKIHLLRQGDTAFIPGNDFHTFTNNNERDFEFICLIPKSAIYSKNK